MSTIITKILSEKDSRGKNVDALSFADTEFAPWNE